MHPLDLARRMYLFLFLYCPSRQENAYKSVLARLGSKHHLDMVLTVLLLLIIIVSILKLELEESFICLKVLGLTLILLRLELWRGVRTILR